MTTSTADDWTWYRAAIAAKNAGKPLPPVSDGAPQFGFFYAKASKAGGRVPVCIFRDSNGDLVARSGTKEQHRIEDAGRRWTWVASSPCERDEYVFAWTNGKWPDGTPTTAIDAPPAMGDNLPSDPFERLMAEIDDKMAEAKALLTRLEGKPADKTAADTARNIQAALLTHGRTADGMHKAEKQPWIDGGKVVDDKFRFRDAVKDVAGRLRTVFENWMRAEEAKARAEAERKFQAERAAAEAERQRIEAERARKLADDPVAALTEAAPELPPIPTAPEPVKVNAGGGVGRAAGLKDVYLWEVVDYEATVHHYRNNGKIREAIEKLVAGDVKLHKADTKIPGVLVKKDRRAA